MDEHYVRAAFGAEGEERIVHGQFHDEQATTRATLSPPLALDQRVSLPIGWEVATVLDNPKGGQHPPTQTRIRR